MKSEESGWTRCARMSALQRAVVARHDGRANTHCSALFTFHLILITRVLFAGGDGGAEQLLHVTGMGLRTQRCFEAFCHTLGDGEWKTL